MAPVISEEKIAEIRQATDIVTVIGENQPLEKAGQNYRGFCPFHEEKTPSFTVNPARQFFHCFGCGSGGDVFAYLQKKEGLTFIEAVKSLAHRGGIALPTASLTPAQSRQLVQRKQLYQIHEDATAFFCRALQNASIAQEYLSRRKIQAETLSSFKVGYAPESWEHLTRYFKQLKKPLELVAQAGLIAQRSGHTNYYDRFRNRIIFPICDEQGRTVAFGGRLLVNDAKAPKYLNSPENTIFNKGRVLYGLPQARAACHSAGHVYLVEGYFDVLVLHQHGLPNTVATLGTALSSEHLKRLKMVASRVTVVFDGDAAGVKAALRSLRLFAAADLAVRILNLPEGHDPDSFVTAYGADAFQTLAEKALAPIIFLMEQAIQEHGLDTEGRLRVVDALLPSLAALTDPLARELYVREVAARLEIRETLLAVKVQQALLSQRPESAPEAVRTPSPVSCQSRQHSSAADQSNCETRRLEERILAMMLHQPEILPLVQERALLDGFQDESLQRLGRLILDQGLDGLQDEPSRSVIDHLFSITRNTRHQEIISALVVQGEPWSYQGCMGLIKQFENCRRRLSSPITRQIKAAEASGDPRLFKLLAEKQQELQRRHSSQIGETP